MSKNEKSRFIYSKAMGEKIPVTEEEYTEFYKEVTRTRKREQYHGRCVCPKKYIWSCDGDCDICEHHISDTLSLDAPNSEDGASLYNTDLAEAKSIENLIEDHIMLEQLLQRFRELDDDADSIINMWLNNEKISDRKVAEALGRPQRTFADQMKKYRKEFRKIRGFKKNKKIFKIIRSIFSLFSSGKCKELKQPFRNEVNYETNL